MLLLTSSYYRKFKLLFFIASYGVKQLDLLYLKIKSLVTICEDGYIIKIVIHHTNILNNSNFKNFYCYTQNKNLEIQLIMLNTKVGNFLTQQHRIYINQNKKTIKYYDHIGYFENDIHFTLTNLKYYFYTWKVIRDLKLQHSMPGFQRQEISKCSNGDIWRSNADNIYNIKISIKNNIPFARINFAYSAMWLLPQKELIKYINDDDFVNIPAEKNIYTISGIKEYYSYYYWEKHFNPIVPLNRIDDCFIHHMSNRYLHHKNSIQINEIYNQMNICKVTDGIKYIGKEKYKEIWISIKNKTNNKCVELQMCK